MRVETNFPKYTPKRQEMFDPRKYVMNWVVFPLSRRLKVLIVVNAPRTPTVNSSLVSDVSRAVSFDRNIILLSARLPRKLTVMVPRGKPELPFCIHPLTRKRRIAPPKPTYNNG